MRVIYSGFLQEDEKELASTIMVGEQEQGTIMYENSNWVEKIIQIQDDEKVVLIFERGLDSPEQGNEKAVGKLSRYK